MSTESNGQRSSPTKWIVAAIAVVLVVIAGIAIVGGGSDSADKGADDTADGSGVVTTDSAGESTDGSTSGEGAPVEAGEFQPVTFTGEALPTLADSVPASGDDPAVGMTAPVLSGYNAAGTAVTIKAAGQPVLLVFLAHWCPHCNAEIPRLIEWKESGDMPGSMQVIGITTGSRDDQPNWPPSQWLVDKEWPWPSMADSQEQDAALAMGVSGYPGLVLLDGDGKVLARRSGEASISELNDWIATALPTA